MSLRRQRIISGSFLYIFPRPSALSWPCKKSGEHGKNQPSEWLCSVLYRRVAGDSCLRAKAQPNRTPQATPARVCSTRISSYGLWRVQGAVSSERSGRRILLRLVFRQPSRRDVFGYYFVRLWTLTTRAAREQPQSVRARQRRCGQHGGGGQAE